MANPASYPGSPQQCDPGPDRTPPSRLLLPLSPPTSEERRPQMSDPSAAHEVLTIFENCRNRGTEPCPRTTVVELLPDQYHQLRRALERNPALEGYVEDKVRFDYDPESGLFSVRMPTPVHDFFSTSVAAEITDRLKCIAEREDEAGKFAAQIANGGSSRIFLREGTAEEESQGSRPPLQHQPDAQFQHRNAAYPGLVLEVSYSQDGKSLEKLAWEYIQHSNGDIKVVIGIDINYAGTKESTVSLWRPVYIHEDGEKLDILDVRRDIECQPFRSSGGSHANQTQCLRLDLSDFTTDELSCGFKSVSLSVPYELLANLLDQAEQMHQTREPDYGGPGIKSKRKTRKRKRSSTPPNLIRSENEMIYRNQKKKATDLAAANDQDFQLPERKRRT